MKVGRTMENVYEALMGSHSDELWKIQRSEIEDWSMSGFPVMVSPELVMLHYEYDFILDGYKIIRIRDIDEYKHDSDSVKFVSSVCKKENITPSMPECLTNVDSWQEVFSQLMEKEVICIVECELSDGSFNMGKIVNVHEDCVEMLCFDGECKVDEEITEILFDDITTVSFGNRYSNVMEKYVEW